MHHTCSLYIWQNIKAENLKYKNVINALQNILFTKAIKEAAAREENLFKDGSINWDYVDADLSIDGWRKKVGEEMFVATIDESATLQRKE